MIESKIPFKIENPILASLIKFGLPIDIIFIIYFLTRYYSDNPISKLDLLIPIIVALLGINIAPYLIWFYDEKLLPDFFNNGADIWGNRERMYDLAKKYDNMFSRTMFLFSIPWTFFLLIAYLQFGGLLSVEHSPGAKSIFYWVGFLAIIWLGALSCFGFGYVITTMLVIRETINKNLCIVKLHPDNLGGLRFVGNYTIGTTLLFSSASLFLPFAFWVISNREISPSLIIVGSSVLSSCILISFFYPIFITHKKAQSLKEDILYELRKKFEALNEKIESNKQDHNGSVINYLELQRLRNEYSDYQNIKSYPVEPEIYVKLAVSMLLPFLFLCIQMYL